MHTYQLKVGQLCKEISTYSEFSLCAAILHIRIVYTLYNLVDAIVKIIIW